MFVTRMFPLLPGSPAPQEFQSVAPTRRPLPLSDDSALRLGTSRTTDLTIPVLSIAMVTSNMPQNEIGIGLPGKPSMPKQEASIPQSSPLSRQSSSKFWAIDFPGIHYATPTKSPLAWSAGLLALIVAGICPELAASPCRGPRDPGGQVSGLCFERRFEKK